jgi:hypothetical protein
VTESREHFAGSVQRLVSHVAHWQARRLAGRADQVYALVQRIADRCADAEHQPHRTVPRLGDPVLPDQLRVVADDLLAAGPPADVLEAAAREVDTVRRAL